MIFFFFPMFFCMLLSLHCLNSHQIFYSSSDSLSWWSLTIQTEIEIYIMHSLIWLRKQKTVNIFFYDLL